MLIEVELCQWIIRNKFHKEAYLYFLLRNQCSGHLKLTKGFYKELSIQASCHSKTAKKHINTLLKEKWLSCNTKKQSLRLNSLHTLKYRLDILSATTVICSEKDLKTPKVFKAFCIGAVLCYQIKQQEKRKKRWAYKRGRARKSCSDSPEQKYDYEYFGLSNSVIRKQFQVSAGTAVEYKKLATKFGFIFCRQRITQTYIPSNQVGKFKKTLPSHDAGCLRKGKYGIYIQHYDEVIPNMEFKTRGKKLKHIRRNREGIP